MGRISLVVLNQKKVTSSNACTPCQVFRSVYQECKVIQVLNRVDFVSTRFRCIRKSTYTQRFTRTHTRKQRMYSILLSFSSFSFSPSTLRIPFHVVRRQDRCVEQRFIHQHSSQSTSKLTMTFWSHFFLMWRSIQSR